MIFGVVMLLLVGGIAYWHYVQGFFSAFYSAISAVLAAVIAVSFQDAVVLGLLKGKMADYANALVMVALFALIYIILRTVFDNLVPGNLRLPVMVDRIGGAAMGLIAAIFTAGIFALAAQALPFGPSIAGYTRYALDDEREVQVQIEGKQQRQDIAISDQLKDDRFTPESHATLFVLPVDDWVVGTVQKLSDGGALAGGQTFNSVHPDLVDEMFAQRLGIQVGAKRTAVNLEGQTPQVSVESVFQYNKDPAKSTVDGELPQIHQRPVSVKVEGKDNFPLVVRIKFTNNAAESDGYVRVSPASVRLVAGGQNYWPVGTVERGNSIYANKIDDYLLISTKDKDRAGDFVFMVDPDKLLVGDPKGPRKVADGVFVEVKRLARIDLSGQEVKPRVPAPKGAKDDAVAVFRKPEIVKDKAKDAAAEAAASAPFTFSELQVSDKLFSPIGVGAATADAANITLTSGTVSLKENKLAKIDLKPDEALQRLKAKTPAVDQLYVPPGMKLVQLQGLPQEGNAWAWADELQKFELVDASGKTYRPAGAFAKVMQKGSARMAAAYDPSSPASMSSAQGIPADIWMAFVVPAGTQLKSLNYSGKAIAELGDRKAE